MVYFCIKINKGVRMEQVTTVKVRKTTAELLREISLQRGRRETMEQVILELVHRYLDENK